MKKKYGNIAKTIANEVLAAANTVITDESIIESMKSNINSQNDFKDLLLTARIDGQEYEIWKSNKNDGKFEVINSSLFPMKTSKNIHSRMTKKEIIAEIISKVLDANK